MAHRARWRPDDGANRWMITGSSSGLGAALWPRVEHRFAATVLGVDRRAQADDADRLCADLATAEGLAHAVEAVEGWEPTVLVNAAGIVQSEDLTSSPPALIDEILSVNLRAPLELMPAMSRRARPDVPVWVVNTVSRTASSASATSRCTARRRRRCPAPVRPSPSSGTVR